MAGFSSLTFLSLDADALVSSFFFFLGSGGAVKRTDSFYFFLGLVSSVAFEGDIEESFLDLPIFLPPFFIDFSSELISFIIFFSRSAFIFSNLVNYLASFFS